MLNMIEKLRTIAARRTRGTNGQFATGRVFTDSERREKNRVKQSRWTMQNREKRLAIAAKERANHQERIRFHNRKDPERSSRSRVRCGARLLGRPRPEVCEIPGCGNAGKIHFDHCHKTEKPRGWLCFNCNAALGHVRDRAVVLRALADYLDAHTSD